MNKLRVRQTGQTETEREIQRGRDRQTDRERERDRAWARTVVPNKSVLCAQFPTR